MLIETRVAEIKGSRLNAYGKTRGYFVNRMADSHLRRGIDDLFKGSNTTVPCQ